MATTDQLIARAKTILSRTNDPNLDARIVTELQAAQERLENEAWLPEFLFSNTPITVTSTSVDLVSLLPRFLRLHDRSGGIWVFNAADTTGEPYTQLKRYDEPAQLKQLFPGDLGAGSLVQGYWMVDTFVEFRPRPSVAFPQICNVYFFESETVLPAVGTTNLWTQKAPDYLLGNAGQILAQSLRDQTAFQIFQGLEAKGKTRLKEKSFGDEQAAQDYVMGD